MKNSLISFRKDEFENRSSVLHKMAGNCQAILNEWKKLEISDITTDEIIDLILNNNAVDFLKDRVESLISKTPSYGGFALKKSAIVDQLEIGDPTLFYNAVATAHQHSLKYGLSTNSIVFKEGVFSVDKTELKLLEESFKVYTRNDEEEKCFAAYKKIVEGLNEMNDFCKTNGGDIRYGILAHPLHWVKLEGDGKYHLQDHMILGLFK